MKFVYVYYGGGMPETEAEQARVMQAWNDWLGGLGDSVADMGNPFSGAVATVSSSGAVRDGQVGERAGGYSIVNAGSLAEATEKAKGCPVLAAGGSVSVYETVDM